MINKVKIVKKYVQSLIKESSDMFLNEIDWKNDYPDASKTCIPIPQLIQDLNDELKRLSVPSNKRSKKDPAIPAFSRTHIKKNVDGDIDVDEFIKIISDRPKKIFSKNAKMEKSDKGGLSYTMNTGIPAFRGIIFDEDNKKFFYLNTCPGAGKCVIGCYARKGAYIRLPNVVKLLSNRLNFLLNDPVGYKLQCIAELEPHAKNLKRTSIGKEPIVLKIRWNDAGDFFSVKYFQIASEVTDYLVKKGYNVESYAYTKIGRIAKLESNVLTNFSTDAKKSEVNSMNVKEAKVAERLPRKVFKDGIFVKHGQFITHGEDGLPMFLDETSPIELKQRVIDFYKGTDLETSMERLKFNWEISRLSGKPNEFDVIILPIGDSDVAAQRKDVRISFLCEH